VRPKTEGEKSRLTLPLLDAVVHLAWHEGKRDDTGDVHLGTKDVHVELELVASGLDVLQTFLVVGTGTADPDLDFVLLEERGDLAESADDTLESRCDLELLSVAADQERQRW